MAGEKKEKYFVEGGQVPEGKDGNLVWSDEHPKGGIVWYSRPVTKAEADEELKKK